MVAVEDVSSMLKRFLVKHNIIKGDFYIEPFVYIEQTTRLPCYCSDTIKWLKPFNLKCLSKDKDQLAFVMLNYKYPEYAGYIQLY